MTITTPADAGTSRCRVRVWFGEHAIADYSAEAELAERYAAAMDRRFMLPVTIDPMPGAIRIDDGEQ